MGTHTLRLTGLAALGPAVGRLPSPSGQVVLVPGGAPGDLALVEETERRKGYLRARLIRVIEAGESRVMPPCEHAAPGRCGGCPWMHVSRAEQLCAKEELVRRALRHTGAEVRPILALTDDLGYRLRARLTQRGGRLGFAAARSHRIEEVTSCKVLHPALDRVLFAAGRRLSGSLGEAGSLRALLGAQDAVHLAVEPGRGGDRAALLGALRALIEERLIAGASLGDEHLGETRVRVGQDEALGPLFASAQGFAQASLAGHEEVVALVRQALAGACRVLELYAGSGNLTRALVRLAREVVAVESDRAAAARLSGTLGGEPGLALLADTAERAVESLIASGARFDAAVLDPPRGGAREIVARLPHLGVGRVVYLSCDPMTLARDLLVLVKAGLRVRHVQPIDLMPHTAHVEVLAVVESERP